MISMSTQVIEIEFSLEKCDMLMMNSGTKDKERKNWTAKSRKYQIAWRKGKLQVVGNIESGHNQTSRKKK